MSVFPSEASAIMVVVRTDELDLSEPDGVGVSPPQSLAQEAVKVFKSPVAETIAAEAARRAAWADLLPFPFAEAAAEMARGPLAAAMEVAEQEMDSLRATMAQAADVADAQQRQINSVLRDLPMPEVPLSVDLPAIDPPTGTTPDALAELGAAVEEREVEQRAHEAATVDLLRGILDRQDEILRRQDAQLDIVRRDSQHQHSAWLAAHVAAVAAVSGLLVAVLPTRLLPLAVPGVAVLYMLLAIGHAWLSRGQSY